VRRKSEDLSPHVRWIVAAMIALTLVILAYQQTHRAEYATPQLKSSSSSEPPDVPTAEGRIKVSAQKQGVRRTEPIVIEQQPKSSP
jgi:hypothetical protein